MPDFSLVCISFRPDCVAEGSETRVIPIGAIARPVRVTLFVLRSAETGPAASVGPPGPHPHDRNSLTSE